MAYLQAENGPESGHQWELSHDRYVLGRHPDCDIVIDVGAVSRHHCRLFAQGQDYFIEDLGSRNGTFLNERLVSRAQPLRDGDRIRVCDVVFSFSEGGSTVTGETLTGSTSKAVLVDDEGASSSTIMSKLEVVGGVGGPQVAATAEAKLHALQEISQSLVKALSLDDVLRQVLDSLFRIFMQADRGFIGLLDDKGELVPRWTKIRREGSDETIRVSMTIARQVMKSKEAILSADAATDSRFEMSQSIADFRIRSMMCAPLVNSDGEAMGILQLDTVDQRQKFQNEDLGLLVSVAAQASVAIVNANLYEDALARRTLERDLTLAREVQRAFLPQRSPELADYDFYDYYRAAHHIGGDYYDYLTLPDGRLAILVADVVGHGIAAAMLMAKLSAEARFCIAAEPDPAKAMTTLNQRICQLELHRFITCIFAFLDPQSHEVTIVSAGHMAPLLLTKEGEVKEPGQSEAGTPLGVVPDQTYAAARLTLEPGESIVLYTDGINEAMSTDQKCFTTEAMKQQLLSGNGTSREIGHRILGAVRDHMGQEPQHDDMCLVVFRRRA